MPHSTEKGAAVYSPLMLKLYDAWVLGLSNRFAWRCPTPTVLLPFFRQHMGPRHLDVGVGTGYYLRHAASSAQGPLTLLDLNANSLHAASHRLGRADTRLIQHDVMTPLPPQPEGAFDSISLFYLLHCLPGTLMDKGVVFQHLKTHIAPDGVIYGATILGDSTNHNALGRKLMALYNRKGIFGNRNDTQQALEQQLCLHFREVQVVLCGKVALFQARGAQG